MECSWECRYRRLPIGKKIFVEQEKIAWGITYAYLIMFLLTGLNEEPINQPSCLYEAKYLER